MARVIGKKDFFGEIERIVDIRDISPLALSCTLLDCGRGNSVKFDRRDEKYARLGASDVKWLFHFGCCS